MIDNKPSKSERPITMEDQLESLRDKKVKLEKKKKVLDKQLENCRSEIKRTARLNKAIQEERDYIKGNFLTSSVCIKHILQQVFKLTQTNSARHAFTTGLSMA